MYIGSSRACDFTINLYVLVSTLVCEDCRNFSRLRAVNFFYVEDWSPSCVHDPRIYSLASGQLPPRR